MALPADSGGAGHLSATLDDPDEGGWERLEALFHEACGMPPDAREAFIESATADEDLRRQVLALLDSAGSASGFFDSLAERVFAGTDPGGVSADAALRDLHDPLVGSTLGPFRVGRLLGRGGMSSVYAAVDQRTGDRVALKLLPPLTDEPRARERFLVEARAIRALSHENVAAIREIRQASGSQPYMVLELYDGETLADRLERERPSLEDTLDILVQTTRGVEHAHDTSIIHRDLKPGNLFLTRGGVVKVLDFGLAKLPDVSLTGTRQTLGTLRYMAPEQVTGGRVDPRADVWSLGVVAYELVTGRPPFDGRNAAAIVNAIVRDEPRPPGELAPDLPDGVAATIVRALERDLERRIPSMAAFRAGLRA